MPGKYKILGYANRFQKNQQVMGTATSTAALPINTSCCKGGIFCSLPLAFQ